MNKFFDSLEMVKLDLFLKYGAIAAAGDRHLAEFCPGSWYLKEPGYRLIPGALSSLPWPGERGSEKPPGKKRKTLQGRRGDGH